MSRSTLAAMAAAAAGSVVVASIRLRIAAIPASLSSRRTIAISSLERATRDRS
jgi:hypothetical protein